MSSFLLRRWNGCSHDRVASTLLIDISTLLRQFSSSAALTGTSGPLTAKARLEHARALLSLLLTFGVSESIDNICREGLSVAPQLVTVNLISGNSLSLLPQSQPIGCWAVSPEVSADKALAIISILQFFMQFEGSLFTRLWFDSCLYFIRSRSGCQHCHDLLRNVRGAIGRGIISAAQPPAPRPTPPASLVYVAEHSYLNCELKRVLQPRRNDKPRDCYSMLAWRVYRTQRQRLSSKAGSNTVRIVPGRLFLLSTHSGYSSSCSKREAKRLYPECPGALYLWLYRGREVQSIAHEVDAQMTFYVSGS